MKLQFDTIHDGEPEAAIILVALAALHPGAVSVLNTVTAHVAPPTFASMAAAHAAADNGYATPTVGPHDGALPPEPDAAAVFAAPQAPAAPPAPIATAAAGSTAIPTSAPATASPPSGLTDKAGWPWDKRIHATGGDGAGVLTDKGVWRSKRGVASETVASVQAELRGQGYGVAPTEAAVTQVYMAAAQAPPPPAATATPPPPPAASAPPPPPAAAAAAPLPGGASSIAEFGRIMTKATNAQKEGKTTVEATLGLVQSLGMTSMADLIAQPQHMPTFEAMLDASIAAAG